MSTYRFSSGRYGNGRTLHDWQRKEAFGLRPQDNWDPMGEAERWLDTPAGPRLHRVLSLAEARAKHPHSRKPRRCEALCPTCDRWVCAGHIGQHEASHS